MSGSPEDDTALFEPGSLEAFVRALLASTALSPDAARLCAQEMVLTNLWGIDSHGILRLPIYLDRLVNGAINAQPDIRPVSGDGAFRILDGDAGIGYVVGHAAVDRAIELALANGIGAVAVRNSNHFGAAALYARKATERGLLCIAMTSVGPNLVVPGGSKPITGNNPLAFGAPTRRGFPLMLDISMSAVAGGKLLLAKEKGERIPEGWATDARGRPTTDPAAGFAGFLLPLGGHKGFGLSLMIDILCGVVSGGAFQFGIKSMYDRPAEPSETAHALIVVDPRASMSEEAFLDRMDEFCDTVKSSPMGSPDGKMYLPGELEHESRLRRLREGIPLPRSLQAELALRAERLGCDASLPEPLVRAIPESPEQR